MRKNARVLSSCAVQRLRVSEGASQRARNAQKKKFYEGGASKNASTQNNLTRNSMKTIL